MHRFFIAPELVKEVGVYLTLPKELAHQVRDVLRLNLGEKLVLLDNLGNEIVATVEASSRAGVIVQLVERHTHKQSSPIRVVLCQGLMKAARFEWVLQKGTELGVAAFAPILCQRSMAGVEEIGAAKMLRWQRIIQEATEQCGRITQPKLLPVRPLARALDEITPGTLAIMPWEEAEGKSLRAVLAGVRMRVAGVVIPQNVLLFIGPEGGLTTEEISQARKHGVHVVTLGPRILRAETAALASIANIMYALEP
ncbi:MAG TPA: RsmE family RNA methyltransferase [Ktedonobacteraceae bacterium]|nr:RsmE family RNA methyltransferase [Ktedonobacteraceae bacterium]